MGCVEFVMVSESLIFVVNVVFRLKGGLLCLVDAVWG